jgi:hypothetical protein
MHLYVEHHCLECLEEKKDVKERDPKGTPKTIMLSIGV